VKLVAFGADGTTVVASSTPDYIKETSDWTEFSHTLTTTANTYFIGAFPAVYGNDGTATLIMDAWFDDVSLTENPNNFASTSNRLPIAPKITAATVTELRPDGDRNLYFQEIKMSRANPNFVLTTTVGVLESQRGQVFKSTDAGANWTRLLPDGTTNYINWAGLACSDDLNYILVGSYSTGGRLWLSSDGGATFTETRPKGNADGNWINFAMSSDGQYMYAQDRGFGFWKSSDYGATWTTAIAGNAQWQSVACDSTGRYAIATINTNSTPIYVTNDYGATWATPVTNVGTGGTPVDGNFVSRCGRFMANPVLTQGVWFSSDYGQSFKLKTVGTSVSNVRINEGGAVFLGRTTANGGNLTSYDFINNTYVPTGLTSTQATCSAFLDGKLYYAISPARLYRADLTLASPRNSALV
jgi:photosystem II stability/assembly factor-like uncharacterized protein